MKHHFVFNKPAIHFILLVGIFTFVFLGAEYLFVNMISLSVTNRHCPELCAGRQRRRLFPVSGHGTLGWKAL